MEKKSTNKTLFYLAFLGIEISILITTLVLSLLLLTIGSPRKQIHDHLWELSIPSTFVHSISLVFFITNVINLLLSRFRNKTSRILGLLLNLLIAIGTVVIAIVIPTNSKHYANEIWNGIETNKTKELLEDYFNCCEVKCASSNITERSCVKKMSSLWIEEEDSSLKSNAMVVAFACLMVVLLLSTATTISFVVLDFLQLKRSSKVTSENKQKDNNKSVAHENKKTAGDGRSNKVIDKVLLLYSQTLEKFLDYCVTKMDEAFESLGRMVSGNKKTSIFLVVIFALTCSTGLIQLSNNGFTFEQFVTEDSQIGKNIRTISKTYKSMERPQSIILSHENVLQPAVIQKAYQLDKSIKLIQNEKNQTFDDVCWRLMEGCKQRSIFELWNFNQTIINSLTTEMIVKTINKQPLRSLVVGDTIDITTILGGFTRDSNGIVTSAKDLFFSYFTRDDSIGSWEDQFIEISLNKSDDNIQVYVNAESSFYTEQATLYGYEYIFLGVGAIFMLLYTNFQLGKCSFVRHRLWISFACLLVIGLATATGVGIGVGLGHSTNQMTPIVAFLIIGIGIDDMFIITQTWDNIKQNGGDLNVKQLAMLTMKKAGVSILVTSVTDAFVFFVGSSSEIVVVKSFNTMCALSLVSLFVYQCTFVLAFLAIDDNRRTSLYDGCLFCFKHERVAEDKQCVKGGFLQWMFDNTLSQFIIKTPVKIVVILISIALAAAMAYFVTQMKVHVDFTYYISYYSYTHQYYRKAKSIVREKGIGTKIYIIGDSIYDEWDNIKLLDAKLKQNDDVANNSIISWVDFYNNWSSEMTRLNPAMHQNFTNSEDFYNKTSMFFQTPIGGLFSDNVRYKDGKMIAMRMSANHKLTKYSSEDEAAMASITDDCKSIKWKDSTTTSFPYTNEYVAFQSGEIAVRETKRNLMSVAICIVVILLITVMSLQLTFWITISVLMTLIDVTGFMHLIGTTMDVTASIGIVLCIGLAVDYSAHVGHSFLIESGTRNERASNALKAIGPAVFNGGFSSFLIIIFLATSQTHSYIVFCQVICSVVLFGLWHGLVFLPVVLSLIGPTQHAAHIRQRETENVEIFVIENRNTSQRLQETT